MCGESRRSAADRVNKNAEKGGVDSEMIRLDAVQGDAQRHATDDRLGL